MPQPDEGDVGQGDEGIAAVERARIGRLAVDDVGVRRRVEESGMRFVRGVDQNVAQPVLRPAEQRQGVKKPRVLRPPASETCT